MDRFELPDDYTTLTDEELDALLASAVQQFDAKASATTISDRDLADMRQLTAAVKAIRAEKKARLEAAAAAAAEIDELAAEVRGEDDPGDATEPEGENDVEGENDGDAGDGTGEAEGGETTAQEPQPEGEVKEGTVVASTGGPRRAVLDLSRVRARQPRVLPEPTPAGPEITASVDVPGYQPGQPLDMEGVTEGIIRRANALKTAGGGVGLTASYRLPFDKSLIINDSSSGTEGTRAVVLAADQSRLPQGDLVASGGWCAPSETVYSLTSMACPEMLWDLRRFSSPAAACGSFRCPAWTSGR